MNLLLDAAEKYVASYPNYKEENLSVLINETTNHLINTENVSQRMAKGLAIKATGNLGRAEKKTLFIDVKNSTANVAFLTMEDEFFGFTLVELLKLIKDRAQATKKECSILNSRLNLESETKNAINPKNWNETWIDVKKSDADRLIVWVGNTLKYYITPDELLADRLARSEKSASNEDTSTSAQIVSETTTTKVVTVCNQKQLYHVGLSQILNLLIKRVKENGESTDYLESFVDQSHSKPNLPAIKENKQNLIYICYSRTTSGIAVRVGERGYRLTAQELFDEYCLSLEAEK